MQSWRWYSYRKKNEKNNKALPNSPCLFISTVRNTFHKSLSVWYTANSARTNQLILILIIFIAKKEPMSWNVAFGHSSKTMMKGIFP